MTILIMVEVEEEMEGEEVEEIVVERVEGEVIQEKTITVEVVILILLNLFTPELITIQTFNLIKMGVMFFKVIHLILQIIFQE